MLTLVLFKKNVFFCIYLSCFFLFVKKATGFNIYNSSLIKYKFSINKRFAEKREREKKKPIQILSFSLSRTSFLSMRSRQCKTETKGFTFKIKERESFFSQILFALL